MELTPIPILEAIMTESVTEPVAPVSEDVVVEPVTKPLASV